MGLTKKVIEMLLSDRQREMLKLMKEPGGVSCTQLVEKFNVGRHIIIGDVRDLRAMGYPIQTFMKTEKNLYGVAFELLWIPENLS